MTNRLVAETSPYLLQHAGNPVDWHPWGEEALALARERDRPILLSVGYSACHWCHVMERESFEDAETARLMNASFVNVKLDREERPDLDSVYMAAVQAMTGQGGWPLTVFLTPGGAPYYGGTYFPPVPRHGMPSFRQVLAAAAEAYAARRDEVVGAGERIARALAESTTARHPATGSCEGDAGPLFDGAVAAAGRAFDPVHGGFGGTPKFPQPMFLEFLLRTGPDPEARGPAMAVHTLARMAAGGIRDHVGGGFHRYSVDARWLVPHFEKMLYDNALVASALVRAHVLGAPGTAAVAEETLDYVLEDLRSPDGVFYCARDADSEGREGAFYVWTPDEVAGCLGREDAELFGRVYDVSSAGNFEGRNIPHLPHGFDAMAAREGMARRELERRMRESLAALKARRAEREAPLRDEKALAGWNGLAIRALAEAGPALRRPDYTAAAAEAAGSLLGMLRRDGRLLRVWTAGRVHVDGFLEDYAAVGNACLSLYEATLEPRWLEEGLRLADATVERFWDAAGSMFWDAPRDGEQLIVRPRDIMDNAVPSGNSLATELAARTARLVGAEEHRAVAEAVVRREAGAMERHPLGAGRLLAAALTARTAPLEIVLVGAPSARPADEATDAASAAATGLPLPSGAAAAGAGPTGSPPARSGQPVQDAEDWSSSIAAMLSVAHRHAHPNRVVAGGDPASPAVAALPAMQGRLDHSGRAYVCVGAACQEPVSSPESLAAALQRAGRAATSPSSIPV